MNDMTRLDVHPEVHDFVARVRAQLLDLDSEEQQELTFGLEADLADLVAEQGPEALGDPRAYAEELRTAAGHDPVMRRAVGQRGFPQAVSAAIDSTHASWNRLLDSLPGDLRGFLTALAPVWWVVRAWVAWMVVQDVRGPVFMTTIPHLVLLAVFLVVSVQLGRGAWRADRLLRRSVLARLLLIGLNVFAVTMTPGAVDRTVWQVAEERAWQFGGNGDVTDRGVNPAVITYRDQQACVLHVFDGNGNRIRDGYVWDATGQRRLPMNTEMC